MVLNMPESLIMGGRFVELGQFNKDLNTPEKEASQGNILKFFLLDTLKTTFWMENLIQRWAFLSKSQFGLFFQKSGQFPNFEIGRVGLAPSCIAVSVAEHTLTSVNISNYLWRYLSTEYAWGLWICMITLHVWQNFESGLQVL